jgi:peptidyl-prolyl cis-trans isomerase SurA
MRISLLALGTLALGFFCTASAQEASHVIGIAAVVGDQVISTTDLNDRVALTMGMTSIPDTQENRARIVPQILRQMVDEKLQMEEATRDSITISDAKLHEGIAQIERQNGKEPGSLEKYLESKGLSKLAFSSEVKAQMAWSEIIMKKVRPRIRISDQEVARYAAHGAANSAHSKEVQIAVIQLPVDAPSNEASVKALADKLVGSIRSGASFEAVAAQFSASTQGTKASEPFWVELSQIDPLVTAALSQAQKGTIAGPVRTASGYQIIKFVDSREGGGTAAAVPVVPGVHAELAFKQVLMTLKPTAQPKEASVLMTLAREVARSPGKCTEKTIAGAGDLDALDFKVTFTRANSADLPEKLGSLLLGLKVGGVSEPVVTPQGIRIFMLCERMDTPASETPASAQDETIRRTIFDQKIDLEAQKFLRDLRREAFIEIRI